MLNKETQAALINLSMDGEIEGFNRYWLNGFILDTNFFGKGNEEMRERILRFLATACPLTQRFYLELCYVCG